MTIKRKPETNKKKIGNAQTSSVVKKMSGILKGKVPEDMDWKVVKMEYLKDKYNL